ncbi:hypothetical protein Y032_0052g2278 [Ancylostoma ceylanicum]|uniref:Uncharacterized protein n=1 Tax=Ancylostoma ceylanicum TaxID=53326 RepID=A0A016U9A6_9BILA|nr:hypothetical protein Y032_0052g2278 [Ancylostoma ceylanicum]
MLLKKHPQLCKDVHTVRRGNGRQPTGVQWFLNSACSRKILFQHGARAPLAQFSDNTTKAKFPNGLGELTAADCLDVPGDGSPSAVLNAIRTEISVLDFGFYSEDELTGTERAASTPCCARTGVDIGAIFNILNAALRSDGIRGSFELGKYLQNRYITKKKFLRTPLLPSQVYFRSRAINRCLMSALAVGSAMFSTETKPAMNAVSVYSYEKDEELLDHPRQCPYVASRLKQKCRVSPPSFTGPLYDAFVYECLGLKSSYFSDTGSFAKAEALVTEVNRTRLTIYFFFKSS